MFKSKIAIYVRFCICWFCSEVVISAQEPSVDGEGFQVAAPGYEYAFPRDHGSHPLYKIEWWYLTGHFKGKGERGLDLGFQATFFRFAEKDPNSESSRPLEVGDLTQLYLSHMALVDKRTGTFVHEERFQRENWDASALEGDLNVRNGNWSLQRDESLGHPEAMQLTGSVLAEARFNFELLPAKPRVIFGENGVSRKGDANTAASLYITFPRLNLKGSIEWEGERHEVSGQAWMDHEISSSQLDQDQVGWDWASIQLNDGREIMMYLMRTQSGEYDRWSKLYWIDREGGIQTVALSDFEWNSLGQWISKKSGTTYPSDFVLTLRDPATGESHSLRLKPVISEQEIVGKIGAINYWEGACDVIDPAGKKIGNAYVELAGYDGQLSERIRR